MKRTAAILTAMLLVIAASGAFPHAVQAEETEKTERILTIDLDQAGVEELQEAVTLLQTELAARKQIILLLEPEEIRLNKDAIQWVKAEVINLTGSLRAKNYEWTTSDERIFTCESGSVRGVNGGHAVLTCTVTLTDGTRLSTECPVYVRIPVSRLVAEENEIEVTAGESFHPLIKAVPEEATNQEVVFSSSDEQIVRIGEDGMPVAEAAGKAVLTAVSADNPDKRLTIQVTVRRKTGKAEGELTFQGLSWEDNFAGCLQMLKDTGFISPESQNRCVFSDSIWFWPENDLLFSRNSAWKTIPVCFTDQKKGTARISIDPQKTIGGSLPQTTTLIFLNGISENGQVDPEITRLIGVYIHFDNRHQKGTELFRSLMTRLEEQYGEFTRYMQEDIPKYYPNLYNEIMDLTEDAILYGTQELGEDVYLGEYVLCTIRGENNTGIMLSIDMSESVTLYYGKTDAAERIRELQAILEADREIREEAGV